MEKITHNLVQGSDEWMRFRLGMFGASEAAAMLNVSKKVSRTELLHMKHSGTPKEFSDWVQKNILDYGHEVEALARPIVEEKFGIDLYPVTCSVGQLSASCDGLTMCEETAFEHKQWNEEMAASVRAEIVPKEHYPQCQQVLMVTGAKRLIFVMSDGTREKMVWMEVFPDTAFFGHLEAGWAQFEKDLAEYVPTIHPEKPQPNAILQLPALAVQIRGEVLTSNLPAFTSAAERFLANIKTDLQTDEDFSNAEETVKFCDRAEKELELAKKAAIEQTVDIAELMRTIDYVKEELRSKRLMLDKLVKTQKEVIKNKIVADARLKFAEHLAAIEVEIKPIWLVYQQPDFQGAIKNKRTLASLHDAVDSTLAAAKIHTDAVAKDVRAKLAWCKENAVGYEFLLADMQQIVYKANEHFQMLVQNRIEQHKLEEKRKLEAERLRIQAEEQKKAEEKVAAQAAEKFKAEQLVRAEQMASELDAIKKAQQAQQQAAAAAQAQVVEAPKPTLVKADPKQVIVERTKPILLTLARRELDDFRNRYSGIPELVMVMEEIETFMIATAEREMAEAKQAR